MDNDKIVAKVNDFTLVQRQLSLFPAQWEAAKLVASRLRIPVDAKLYSLLSAHASSLISIAKNGQQASESWAPVARTNWLAPVSAIKNSWGLSVFLAGFSRIATEMENPGLAKTCREAFSAPKFTEEEALEFDKFQKETFMAVNGYLKQAFEEASAGSDLAEALERARAKANATDLATNGMKAREARSLALRDMASDAWMAEESKIDALIPKSWKGGAMTMPLALVNTSTKPDTRFLGIDAQSFDNAVLASRALGELAKQASAIGKAIPKLRARAESESWSQTERIALSALELSCNGLLLIKGAIRPGDKIEIQRPETRFSPQSAYAIYLPPNAMAGFVQEGFWQDQDRPNVDLGEAKLFDTRTQAKQHFATFSSKATGWAIVELTVAPKAILECHGTASLGSIVGDLARAEAAKLDEQVKKLEIEALRRRLAELEGHEQAPPRGPKMRL